MKSAPDDFFLVQLWNIKPANFNNMVSHYRLLQCTSNFFCKCTNALNRSYYVIYIHGLFSMLCRIIPQAPDQGFLTNYKNHPLDTL